MERQHENAQLAFFTRLIHKNSAQTCIWKSPYEDTRKEGPCKKYTWGNIVVYSFTVWKLQLAVNQIALALKAHAYHMKVRTTEVAKHNVKHTSKTGRAPHQGRWQVAAARSHPRIALLWQKELCPISGPLLEEISETEFCITTLTGSKSCKQHFFF